MNEQLVIRYDDMLANLDGQVASLAELGGRMLDGGRGEVQVGSRFFRLEREMAGKDGTRGGLYRRFSPAGWQVLVTAELLDGDTVSPLLREPVADRAQAELEALQFVTRNRSSFGTAAKAALVWQAEDGTVSEPVAICDGSLYTRGQAAQLRLADEVVDWTWVQDVEPEPEPAEVMVEVVTAAACEPEPGLDWAAAVGQAMGLAMAAFAGNEGVLSRLAGAQELALGQPWTQLDDAGKTFVMSGGQGKMYQVNGRCQCSDYLYRQKEHGGWCKHRLGRALALRAVALQGQQGQQGQQALQAQKEAGDADTSPAPVAAIATHTTQPEYTTDEAGAQVDLAGVVSVQFLGAAGVQLSYTDRQENRLDVDWGAVAVQARGLGWTCVRGALWNPAFDEWVAADHARRLADLRGQTLVPQREWVAADHARQAAAARDAALPVEYTGGRSRLFKN